MKRNLFLFCAAMAFSGTTLADQGNALGTCYGGKLQGKPGPLDSEIFIAIDQTTSLDVTLRQLVADNIKPFLAPNNGFAVLTFSAFTQGHYTEVVSEGRLDPLIESAQRSDISKPLLSKFDQCMTRQVQQGAQAVGGALRKAFDGTTGDIAKSDVMASLKAISTKVNKSTARNKVVLIVSDMLENSSVSSFYANKGQSVNRIDPVKEMKTAEENRLFGDFNGAKVYVIGAGLLPEDSKKGKSYRDPKTMQALSVFWKSYFDKSNAQLVELGQPALLNPVK